LTNALRPWDAFDDLVAGLARLQEQAQAAAARSVDEILTARSWLIGAWLIAYEQDGADRARYGDRLLASLAEEFRRRGVKGLSESSLKNCRQIAIIWPMLGIRQTLSGELVPLLPRPADVALSWQDDAWMDRLRRELSFSHLLELSRVDKPIARAFYEVEAIKNGWGVRELRRQRDSMLFERVGLSRDKGALVELAASGRIAERPAISIRDPYILEFAGLEGRAPKSEAELEGALVDHLEAFLLELGRDFCFMGRQFRITVGGRHHFIDLLFYQRRLRCLVAIDLKLGTFGYEDAGQMNFYLNFLRENMALADENPPVGIILCADKDVAEVHYATGSLDQQVFVSRYLVALPKEEELRKWLLEEQDTLTRILEETGRSREPSGSTPAKPVRPTKKPPTKKLPTKKPRKK